MILPVKQLNMSSNDSQTYLLAFSGPIRMATSNIAHADCKWISSYMYDSHSNNYLIIFPVAGYAFS